MRAPRRARRQKKPPLLKLKLPLLKLKLPLLRSQ
jgi:hypothetical protein